MKAAVLRGPENILVQDMPKPKPGKYEVLINVRCCGICGSDLGIYKMGFGDGLVMGHEFSGDIVEVGEGVKDWQTGDRVVVEPSVVCGECYWCKRQEYNRCNSWGSTGIVTDGGFAEFVKAPEYQLHRLPKEVSYEEGALVEPLSVALHAVWLSRLKPGASVAVFGCGSLGVLVALWANAVGADKTFATEVAGPKITIAEKFVDVVINPKEEDPVNRITELTGGLGPDIVFECSGNAMAEVQALEVVRKGGQVIILGMPHEPTSLDLLTLGLKEITLKGALAYSSLSGDGEFPTSINFIKARRIDPNPVVTSKIPLDDIVEKGFMKMSMGEDIKILVTP
ncbi:MAG: alcohol dehydrogenase catalytic domain-containing protein [Deltaproteobacteria bacterium]|nr:alcohol dehydrogenase catalytic domain-containing protein [Deltaproteobacteria bacterium]